MSSPLTEGDPAPDFSGPTQTGETVSLAQYRGKTVVLYFYPKDNTSGCTEQACSFRDSYADLRKRKVVLIGVSPDSVKSHGKFVEKYTLPFPLIADEEKTILQAYGVWVEKSMYGRKYMGAERSIFIIDGDGKIKTILRKVKPGESTAKVLAALDQ